MIKFSVSRAEKEPVYMEGSEGPEFWDLPEEDLFHSDKPVKYELCARNVSGSIQVTGKISGIVYGSCGRCLKEVSREIVNDSVELYYFKDEIDVEELDITADVRDELLIDLPMNLLCSEECRGLCPVCGIDLNKKKCSCQSSGSLCWSALDDIVTEEK